MYFNYKAYTLLWLSSYYRKEMYQNKLNNTPTNLPCSCNYSPRAVSSSPLIWLDERRSKRANFAIISYITTGMYYHYTYYINQSVRWDMGQGINIAVYLFGRSCHSSKTVITRDDQGTKWNMWQRKMWELEETKPTSIIQQTLDISALPDPGG